MPFINAGHFILTKLDYFLVLKRKICHFVEVYHSYFTSPFQLARIRAVSLFFPINHSVAKPPWFELH